MPLNLTRSVVWIILPGWVAVFPWLLALGQLFPDIKTGYISYTALYHAAGFSVVVMAGSLSQAFAGYLEAALDDALERSKNVAVKEEWLIYLSARVEPEPVGYRYISRAVTSLKYELAMVSAAPASLIGCAVFLASKKVWQLDAAVLGALILCVPIIWAFYKQARDTHLEINSVRAELNRRMHAKVENGGD